MKKQMIMLRNLNCPNCAAKLEKALSKMEGVKSAKVSFGSGTLNIEYDSEKLPEDKIKQMIAQFNVGVGAVLPGRSV